MSFLGALLPLVRPGRFPFLFCFLNLVKYFQEESNLFGDLLSKGVCTDNKICYRVKYQDQYIIENCYT